MKSIKLKFVGANGSMGLEHGKVYDVKLKNTQNFIWVTMDKGRWSCPYSSPQTFAVNWRADNGI